MSSIKAAVALAAICMSLNVHGRSISVDQDSLPDRYIITLKGKIDRSKHLDYVRSISPSHDLEHDLSAFEGVTHEYSVGDYQAYAGHFNSTVIAKLHENNDVEAIHTDQLMTTAAVITQKDCSPGLGLISHRGLGHEDKGYSYDSSAGLGTYAYVIDTGIDVKHKDFEGRAFNAHLIRKKGGWGDTSGHGTKVAGIIGSRTYGVAKKCRLLSVKVMEEPTGPLSDVMMGFDWSVKDIIAHKRKGRAVITLSITGPHNPSFNRIIDSAFKLGITTVAAAGNDGADASTSSPGSSPYAISVAATNLHRVRAPDSNYGKTITLFAPGVDIESTAPGDTTATGSGTSMAAAYVTGIALYVTGIRSMIDPRMLKALLLKIATPRVVGDAKGSPNLFAYNNAGSMVGLLPKYKCPFAIDDAVC